MVSLEYDALDDLAFAGVNGELANVELLAFEAVRLGPFIEMAYLAATNILPRPTRARWLNLGCLGELASQLAIRRHWISPASDVGFFKLTDSISFDSAEWVSFVYCVQSQAERSGFSRLVAAQLAATVGELAGNIAEHSEATGTGLAVFRGTAGRMEIVLADAGVGILASLRKCTDFRLLDDHGEALSLSLAEGVSRHGRNSNRGYGFRPIFVGLANLNSVLRFRSGDHALTIDGTSPALENAQLVERVNLGGFVASIECRN